MPSRIIVLAPLMLGLLAAAEPVGFRGDGSGRYPEADAPTAWAPDRAVVWKTAMPDWSNASPVLVGDRIFVCAEPATLVCVAVADGRILWQDTLPGLPQPAPKTHEANGFTSATPVSDGKRVWAVFGQGLAACWDAAGKRQWAVTLEKPPNGWGSCISPRLAGGVVAVQFDSLYGLDPATGVQRWKLKTPWGWGTPAVAAVGKKEVLITCKGVVVDPASGKELSKGMPQLEYNSPCLVDGAVYFLQQKPQAFAVPALKALWQAPDIAGDRYYATPLVHDGLVYAINQQKNLTVLDVKTGARIYEKKLEHIQGTVYPSPTLGGKFVFISGEQGQTLVLTPGRTYAEVARNSLEPFRSCPVFVGKRMYLRGRKNLWCIGE